MLCLADVVISHEIEAIQFRQELVVFREVARERLAELEQQIDEVEDEAIGRHRRLGEHLLLVHVEEDGHAHPL